MGSVRSIQRKCNHKRAKVAVGVGTAFGSVLGLASSAFAAPVDPTAGAADDLATAITDWVSTYALPAMVTVLSLGLIVSLLVKYARRFVGAA